jgi:hypothetical protein
VQEGLSGVITPTVKSIKQAISTYELQGGSANMFINDISAIRTVASLAIEKQILANDEESLQSIAQTSVKSLLLPGLLLSGLLLS